MNGNPHRFVGRRTFSQRFGYAPVPTPMQLEEISADLRREIWNANREVLISMRDFVHQSFCFTGQNSRLIERVLGRFLEIPEDAIDIKYAAVLSEFKRQILENTFDKVLDITEIFSNENPSSDFAEHIADLFETHAAAYWLDVTPTPLPILPT